MGATDRVGFEPTVLAYADFQDRCFKPLSHLPLVRARLSPLGVPLRGLGGNAYLFMFLPPIFFVGFVPVVLRPERSTLVALNSPNL